MVVLRGGVIMVVVRGRDEDGGYQGRLKSNMVVIRERANMVVIREGGRQSSLAEKRRC